MTENIELAAVSDRKIERIFPISAAGATSATLTNLKNLIGEEKVKEVVKPITDLIEVSMEEGSFSCIITNNMIEELFSLDSNSFDDTILQFVINMLRELGYKVSDNELVYGDPSNYIEISWYANNAKR